MSANNYSFVNDWETLFDFQIQSHSAQFDYECSVVDLFNKSWPKDLMNPDDRRDNSLRKVVMPILIATHHLISSKGSRRDDELCVAMK